MVSLREVPHVKRFGLASLLLFVTIVALALGLPHYAFTAAATAPFVLFGTAAIAFGWRSQRHRLSARAVGTLVGLALLAAGVWVLLATLPE